MDEVAKLVLKDLKAYIKDNLCNSDFPQILDFLENKGILTDTHVQQIQAEKTDNGKISKLLYILPRRGPDAFNMLVDSLRPEYDFIADKLQAEFEKEKHKQTEADDNFINAIYSSSSDDKTDGQTSVRASQDSATCITNTLSEETQTLCSSCMQDEGIPVVMIPNVAVSSINQKLAQVTLSNHIQAQASSNNTAIVQVPSSNQKLAQTASTNQIPAKDQSMKTNKLSDEADNSKGSTKGPNDRWQPMRTGHSEFIKEMTNESLNYLHTKLNSHLTTRNMRELSFKSPEPVTFAMVDNLLDQLIEEMENCFQALGARDRHSLLTHIISLKTSKKELKVDLKEAQEQKNKYATALIKQQNKNRMMSEQVALKDKEFDKLSEENKELENTIQDYEKQLKILTDEFNDIKGELEQKDNDLRAVEEEFQFQSEYLKTLKDENDVLREELKVTKKYQHQPKKCNTVISPRNGLHYGRNYPVPNLQSAESEAIMFRNTMKKAETKRVQTKPTQTKAVKDSSQGTNKDQHPHISNNKSKRTSLPIESVKKKNKPYPYGTQIRNHPQSMTSSDQHEPPLASLGIFCSKKQ